MCPSKYLGPEICANLLSLHLQDAILIKCRNLPYGYVIVLLCLENEVNETGGSPGERTDQYPFHQMTNSEAPTRQQCKVGEKRVILYHNLKENDVFILNSHRG